jgi:hypothetical protein
MVVAFYALTRAWCVGHVVRWHRRDNSGLHTESISLKAHVGETWNRQLSTSATRDSLPHAGTEGRPKDSMSCSQATCRLISRLTERRRDEGYRATPLLRPEEMRFPLISCKFQGAHCPLGRQTSGGVVLVEGHAARTQESASLAFNRAHR